MVLPLIAEAPSEWQLVLWPYIPTWCFWAAVNVIPAYPGQGGSHKGQQGGPWGRCCDHLILQPGFHCRPSHPTPMEISCCAESKTKDHFAKERILPTGRYLSFQLQQEV